MGTSDGKITGTKKIVNKGPDSTCFNIVLVAEGYKNSEQADFNNACNDLVKALFALAPYGDCASRINVHRINVESTESGADDPKTKVCAGAGTTAKTYFDASYCTNGIKRLMHFDRALAIKTLNAQVPDWDRAILLVNSSPHGGAGGKVAITSTGGSWTDTALHEFGHSLGLADEYEYWVGCPGTKETSSHKHSAVEPDEPNVTTKTKRHDIKWRTLILPTTKVPTTKNADCTKCDTQGNPMPAGTIGLYEGAHYCHCGAYRPSFNCLMRHLGQPHCDVCKAWIRKKISAEVEHHDLAITPWGYAMDPPKSPYWQTPDIWGNPKTGQAKNDLHIRVRNAGKSASPPFKVRVSFVPFTGVIDLANEIVIDTVSRPGLAGMGTDSFTLNWDLTPPKLPKKYAKSDHFCVIAEIQSAECNTPNNRAQNNFTIVTKPSGGAPPPVRFEIANPWDQPAELSVRFKTGDPRLTLRPMDFDPEGMILAPLERRDAQVEFQMETSLLQDPDAETPFEITQALDEQVLGGVGGVIRDDRSASVPHVACPRCGSTRFVYRLEGGMKPGTRVHGALVKCADCATIILTATSESG